MTAEPSVALVLDVGTSSARAALVDPSGDVVALAGRRHSLAPDADGATAVDAGAAWDAVADGALELVATADSRGLVIAGVASTSIRGGFVLLDAEGDPLWACGSLDGRAHEEVVRLGAAEPAFHEATGQHLLMAALPRLRWLASERPAVWRAARTLLTLDAWLAYRLTGAPVMPVTSAAPTGLLDAATGEWLADGPEPWRPDGTVHGLLPPLADAGTVVRGVSASAAARTGLPIDTPVAVAGGDAQMAALGVACLEPGDVALILGSHWQCIVELSRPAHDPGTRFRVITGPVRGSWQADAIALGVGLQLDALVDGLAAGHDHADLSARAEALGPGAGGVLAAGAAPLAQGAWMSAAPTLIGASGSGPAWAPAAVWRAIVESGALVVRDDLALVLDTIPDVPAGRPVRVGGGVSRSDLACRILAAVLDRPVERGAHHQSSLLGAAVCVGVVAGWYADLAEGARRVAATAARFEPDADDHAAYRALGSRWRAVIDAQLALVRAGVTQPLMRLPH